MTETVQARPRRARVVAIAAAIAVVVFFTIVATALRGPTGGGGTFQTGDQIAMVGLGIIVALAVLSFARPKVEADLDQIRIRNIVGSHELPWSAVRSVQFNDGSPWVSLELSDDDTVAVMAVQAADKHYAVEVVRALRRLHEAAQSAEHHSGTGADQQVSPSQ